MLNVQKSAFAVFEKNRGKFVYADMGRVKLDVLPRKSSVRETLDAAKDLLDRYEFYFTKHLQEAKDKFVEKKKSGPRYDLYRSRAEAKRSHEDSLECSKREITHRQKEVDEHKKNDMFVIVEISMKVV